MLLALLRDLCASVRQDKSFPERGSDNSGYAAKIPVSHGGTETQRRASRSSPMLYPTRKWIGTGSMNSLLERDIIAF